MKNYVKIAERCAEVIVKLLKAIEEDVQNGTVECTFVTLARMGGRWIGKTLGALLGGVIGQLAGGPISAAVGSAIGGVLGRTLGGRLGKAAGKMAAAKVQKLIDNLREREATHVKAI